MHKARVKLNLAPYDVTQFDSIEEAQTVLPEEILLRWINLCWRNCQSMKLIDAEREARKEKK